MVKDLGKNFKMDRFSSDDRGDFVGKERQLLAQTYSQCAFFFKLAKNFTATPRESET